MELGSHGLWNRTTCILPERHTIVECAVALSSGMGSCAGENYESSGASNSVHTQSIQLRDQWLELCLIGDSLGSQFRVFHNCSKALTACHRAALAC